jgi:hypothetical protein
MTLFIEFILTDSCLSSVVQSILGLVYYLVDGTLHLLEQRRHVGNG